MWLSTRTGGSAERQRKNASSPVRLASTVSSDVSSRSECTARRYSAGVRQNANGIFNRQSAVWISRGVVEQCSRAGQFGNQGRVFGWRPGGGALVVALGELVADALAVGVARGAVVAAELL